MVVYRVLCECGQAYIEKTMRRLESRMKEHKDTCNQGQLENLPLLSMPGDMITLSSGMTPKFWTRLAGTRS